MTGTMRNLDGMLKRLYSADEVQNLVYRADASVHPRKVYIVDNWVFHNPRPQFGAPSYASGAIGTATVLVCTSVAALEWLRRRKAEVAAAEKDEAAFNSLLDEFVAWLAALLVRLGLREAA